MNKLFRLIIKLGRNQYKTPETRYLRRQIKRDLRTHKKKL